MAGELILIVDDTPINLKLTRILLQNEGYQVVTAMSAEAAFQELRTCHPDLILTDIQLPGMDGLEFTRRLKSNPATSGITMVALTAYATSSDEQKAIEAGCAGFITKPIDTRGLGSRVREFLTMRGPARPASLPAHDATPEPEIPALRERFLSEGLDRLRRLLLDVEGRFVLEDAAKSVHQWVGTGGLLGYGAISRLAREAEALLHERPTDNSQLREALTTLALAFLAPGDDAPPMNACEALAGKRIGCFDLTAEQAGILAEALREVGANLRPLPALNGAQAAACAAIVAGPAALAEGKAPVPLVLAVSSADLLSLAELPAIASDFLLDSWTPGEALARLYLALLNPARREPTRQAHPTALLADAGAAPLAQAITELGVDCFSVASGGAAMDAIRLQQPAVAALTLGLPGLDVPAALAASRREKLAPVVALLPSGWTEPDLLRLVAFGADDFAVAPSPGELLVRFRRLLRR